MFYEPFTYERFFSEITTEEDARRLIWHARFNGKDFYAYQHNALELLSNLVYAPKKLSRIL